MIDADLLLKLVHLVSAAILFGAGVGTAFFMWRTDRSGDIAALAVTSRHVVQADWCFTAPAVIVSPASGLLLAWRLDYDLTELWLLSAVALYLFVGLCWLPVVWLQIRMRNMAAEARAAGTALPPPYRRYMRIWQALGWPAFGAMIAIFALMVFKPGW